MLLRCTIMSAPLGAERRRRLLLVAERRAEDRNSGGREASDASAVTRSRRCEGC